MRANKIRITDISSGQHSSSRTNFDQWEFQVRVEVDQIRIQFPTLEVVELNTDPTLKKKPGSKPTDFCISIIVVKLLSCFI